MISPARKAPFAIHASQTPTAVDGRHFHTANPCFSMYNIPAMNILEYP